MCGQLVPHPLCREMSRCSKCIPCTVFTLHRSMFLARISQAAATAAATVRCERHKEGRELPGRNKQSKQIIRFRKIGNDNSRQVRDVCVEVKRHMDTLCFQFPLRKFRAVSPDGHTRCLFAFLAHNQLCRHNLCFVATQAIITIPSSCWSVSAS